METRTTACSLRISAGGAVLAGVQRERVLGPLWLPPPFPLRESLFGDSSSFHFSCESDGVSLPQAVRSPQYTIS